MPDQEGAIQTDVPVEEPKEPVKSRRELAYEAIVEARAAERPETVVEAEPKKEEPNEPMIDLVDAKGNAIRIPASARFKAKIDGQEVETPIEQMTRSYQKGAAADRRLEEAGRKQRELEAKEASLSQREQAFLQQMNALNQKKEEGALSKDGFEEKADKLLAALTMDDDEARKAVVDVFKSLSPNVPVDESALMEKATRNALAAIEQREAQKRQAQLEADRLAANARFEKDFKDVIEDPIAYAAAAKLANAKWAERPDAAPWEIASEVGSEIREWKKASLPEKRRELPSITPRTVSARASIGRDPKPQTRGDILAEMKKSRGQAT